MSTPESDEPIEQFDENDSYDETTKAAKRRCLVGLLLLAVVMGVLDQLVVQKQADRVVTLVGGLVSIVLIFIWCQNDSYQRSYKIPKLLRLLIIFVAILGVPIYLLRTRGRRGILSMVKLAAFFGICVLFTAIAGAITYFIQCR
jgi:hypothetical protein